MKMKFIIGLVASSYLIVSGSAMEKEPPQNSMPFDTIKEIVHSSKKGKKDNDAARFLGMELGLFIVGATPTIYETYKHTRENARYGKIDFWGSFKYLKKNNGYEYILRGAIPRALCNSLTIQAAIMAPVYTILSDAALRRPNNSLLTPEVLGAGIHTSSIIGFGATFLTSPLKCLSEDIRDGIKGHPLRVVILRAIIGGLDPVNFVPALLKNIGWCSLSTFAVLAALSLGNGESK